MMSGFGCTAVSNHLWAGQGAPKFSGPKDIGAHVKTSVNGKVGPFARATGFFTTPLKHLGIAGWRDLGYDGEVTGVVQQTAISTDQFYTVDMRVETLQIGGQDVSPQDERYLRAEVCLRDVSLLEKDWPRGTRVWMRGRMMWDGDGFIEIHPRNGGEVHKIN